MSLSSIPRALRIAVFERDSGRCRYCGLSQLGQASVFHINHVVPRSRGGQTEIENLALQCPHCSLHKSNTVVWTDPESRAEVSLFHPLRDAWDHHFALEADGRCVGIAPIGRATVDALGMNDPLPKTPRALQLLLGVI